MQNKDLYLDICQQRQMKLFSPKPKEYLFRATCISCLQLIKLKASIISGHLCADALIRQLWYRSRRGKSRPLASHFPGRKEAFRLTLPELQDDEKRTVHLLYTQTEVIPLLSLPALAGKHGGKRPVQIKCPEYRDWLLNNCNPTI